MRRERDIYNGRRRCVQPCGNKGKLKTNGVMKWRL